MSDERWQDPAKAFLNPRYIILMIAANILLAAGVVGVLPEKMGMAEVFGDIYTPLHDNWITFISAAFVVGLLNAVFTFLAKAEDKKRSKSSR